MATSISAANAPQLNIIVPVSVQTLLNRDEQRAQKRANSFAKLQENFAGCELTDEEIRQECEAVRQEMYSQAYANLYKQRQSI